MAYIVTKCLLGKHLDNAGLKQIDLARRTGIHKSQISQYVNMRYGKPMDIAHARTIADALGLESPYDLYEWDITPPSRRTND
jgi:transcriptional regulator with XRE-family HTH domain